MSLNTLCLACFYFAYIYIRILGSIAEGSIALLNEHILNTKDIAGFFLLSNLCRLSNLSQLLFFMRLAKNIKRPRNVTFAVVYTAQNNINIYILFKLCNF